MIIDYDLIDQRAEKRKGALEKLSARLEHMPAAVAKLRDSLKFFTDIALDVQDLDSEGRELLTYDIVIGIADVGKVCQSATERLGTTQGYQSIQRLLDLLEAK